MAAKYELTKTTDGGFRFDLKAANQQVIGTSQMYASEEAMEKGVESVETNGPDAGTDDQT